MPIAAIRIEEGLWHRVTDLRRQEWRTLIGDVLGQHAPFPALERGSLVIDLDEDELRITFREGAGAEPRAIPRSELGALIDEYRGVIDRLGDEGNSVARMEALDMAKKVVHDEGARRLGSLLPDLSPDHETRRRFFSLVVALAVDTTRCPWAHRHL